MIDIVNIQYSRQIPRCSDGYFSLRNVKIGGSGYFWWIPRCFGG